MNAEIYLELLREAHLAAIQRGATLTGGTRLGLGERIDDDMQFNTETGFQDTPGTYPVPSESRELNVFADAALAEMKVGLTRQELVGVLVDQFNIPRSNLVYAWDIPTYAVMRDGQRQTELEPEFFTGNPLDPTSKGPMQHSTYRPNNWWAGRQGKDVSGQTTVRGVRDDFDTATGFREPVAKYPNAEGPIYKHTNPFIANSATGWGIEAALSAVVSPTGLKAGKRLLGPLFRAMPQLPPGILARFKGVARNSDDWVSPHAKPFDYEAGIGRAADGLPGTPQVSTFLGDQRIAPTRDIGQGVTVSEIGGAAPSWALGNVDRPFVLVRKADGSLQPFYRSTGTNSQMEGEWLPFDGFGGSPGPSWYRKDRFTHGEFAKGTPLHRFGSEENKAISDLLGRELGDADATVRFDMEGVDTEAYPGMSYEELNEALGTHVTVEDYLGAIVDESPTFTGSGMRQQGPPGTPTTYYHGTAADFEDFDYGGDLLRPGTWAPGRSTANADSGLGFHFSTSSESAEFIGPNIMERRLRLENPLEVDEVFGAQDLRIRAYISELGLDDLYEESYRAWRVAEGLPPVSDVTDPASRLLADTHERTYLGLWRQEVVRTQNRRTMMRDHPSYEPANEYVDESMVPNLDSLTDEQHELYSELTGGEVAGNNYGVGTSGDEITREWIKSFGYDGLHIREAFMGPNSRQYREGLPEQASWVVFDPDQISKLEGPSGTPTGDVPPVHSQRGAFDQDSEFDQTVASLWEEMDRIRGELPQGPVDPTRGNFRPRGFEDGTKSADRLREPRPEMWGDNVGGGGEPPRRNNVFDGDFSYDGWDEERLLNRQAEIVDGADAGGWELTDEGDGGWLLYVEHFNIENELRLRRGQQPLPANPTDRVGSMHDAASRGEYFEWLAEVQLPFVRGGSFDQTQIVPLDDLDRHLDSVWEQMLGETDSSSLSFTDALKSLGSGAAIAGATAVTAQTLFPEQVEKVVSGLATFNDGWWSWIKEFPEHLDWVVRAAGATLDGMEQGTRSMGSPVLDGLSDGFREEAGGWMGSLGGGAVPVMGRQDASMLKGLSKDLSEQGHNGQAMFPNDIRREIENGDAMIVGYRSDADYQRAVEESGQYGIEVDRHFWRKPNRKNIRPAEGQPWTSDNLKKLAATNYFYPDAGVRRGPR